jgi:hypothetical protein
MKLPDSLKRRLLAPFQDHENAGPIKRRLGAIFLRYAPLQVTCEDFERFVIDYHEGHLTDRQRAVFEFHMEICPMCRVHFRSYVKAVQMGQRLYEDEVAQEPAELPEDLIAAVLEARRAAG